MGLRPKDIAVSTTTLAVDDWFVIDGLTNGTRRIQLSTVAVTGSAADLTGVLAAARFPAFTGGDVTSSAGSLVLTIGSNMVTLAKFQQVATGTVIGRNTAGTGNIEVLTTLPTAVMPAHTGDVTSSAGSLSLTIANNAVTLAKMATMATASFLGRNTAAVGNVEVLSVATVRTMLSINNVENTALSTWAGSANITTLGTISSGTVPVARVSGLAASATTDTTNASNISTGSLALARIATIGANTILGNNTGGAAVPAALSVAQVQTLLGLGSAAYTASTAYPSTTGSGASGTWGISITGSAGSVAWTNVSGRPTVGSMAARDVTISTGTPSGGADGDVWLQY